MVKVELSEGTVHKLPADLRAALSTNKKLLTLWEDITPLARNEFICWVESAKQVSTRHRRIKRTCEELLEGQRRPCCWMGCIHRTDKSISPSVQGILDKQSKKLKSDFPSSMGKVAPRELLANGIRNLKQTTKYTEKELLAIHGVGPKAIRIIKEELAKKNLTLKISN